METSIISRIGHALSYGGTTAIIGMFIVFLGLSILIGFVTLMAKIFKAVNARKAAKAEAEAKAAAAAAAAAAPAPQAAEPEPVEEAVEEDDPQLIAVIAAAIAAFDDTNKRLVVRKVRRVPGWGSRF